MEVFIIKLTNENIELKLGSEKKTRHGILGISKDLSKSLKQQFLNPTRILLPLALTTESCENKKFLSRSTISAKGEDMHHTDTTHQARRRDPGRYESLPI